MSPARALPHVACCISMGRMAVFSDNKTKVCLSFLVHTFVRELFYLPLIAQSTTMATPDTFLLCCCMLSVCAGAQMQLATFFNTMHIDLLVSHIRWVQTRMLINPAHPDSTSTEWLLQIS